MNQQNNKGFAREAIQNPSLNVKQPQQMPAIGRELNAYLGFNNANAFESVVTFLNKIARHRVCNLTF